MKRKKKKNGLPRRNKNTGKLVYGRPEKDLGSPELLQRKAEALGACSETVRKIRRDYDRGELGPTAFKEQLAKAAGCDLSQSYSALARLYADDVLTQDEFKAGALYGALRWKSMGKPFPLVPQVDRIVQDHKIRGTLMDDTGSDPALSLYKMVNDRLIAKGRRVHTEVQNVTVYDRDPSWWVRKDNPRPSDQTSKLAFTEGLRVLQEVLYTGR